MAWFELEAGPDDVACRLSLSAFMHCITAVARPHWNTMEPKRPTPERKRFNLHKASLGKLGLIKSSEGDGLHVVLEIST